MSNRADLRVTLANVSSADQVLALWRDLEVRANRSFFLSSSWIESWLKSLTEQTGLRLVQAMRDGQCVGLGLFGLHCDRRRGAIVTNGWHLHETGLAEFDHLTIEHNGFLVDASCEQDVLAAIMQSLAQMPDSWDELHLSAINTTNPLNDVLAQPPAPVLVRIVKESPSAIVDLRRVREAGGDYLSQLSSNTRQQIRRAMRLHEHSASLEIDQPASVQAALAFFQELKRLHQAYWTSRGEPGAFASDFAHRFHQSLISHRWDSGEIQLWRVRCGARVVGYLYNFVDRGRVSFYQSGIDYGGDPKLKPGLVCQVLAVQRNLELGADVYDFLAGESQYKQSLSTDSELLRWYVWQQPRWTLRLENWLRDAKRRLSGLSRLA